MPKLKLSNCIVIVLASLFQAFGIYNVHSLSNVTEGGVLGATLLIQHWFHISPALSALVLNIACYTLGWRTLGRSFLAYSAISILTYSAGYAFLEQFNSNIFPFLERIPSAEPTVFPDQLPVCCFIPVKVLKTVLFLLKYQAVVVLFL